LLGWFVSAISSGLLSLLGFLRYSDFLAFFSFFLRAFSPLPPLVAFTPSVIF
jgi:hypothetical protein